MNNIEFERAKGIHALSDAQYEERQKADAEGMRGTKPWLDPEHYARARGVKVYGDFDALLATAKPAKPNLWKRFKIWLRETFGM